MKNLNAHVRTQHVRIWSISLLYLLTHELILIARTHVYHHTSIKCK